MGDVSDNNVSDASNLLKRQIEINEWSYGNKLDTLFVYQSLFITLTFITILAFLLRFNIIGNTFFYSLSILLLFIFSLIVMNRAQYTNFVRDRRYWNRRKFREQGTEINIPSCQTLTSASDYASLVAERQASDAAIRAQKAINKLF
jgi:hypothetical protein